jgi:hypothetical protein
LLFRLFHITKHLRVIVLLILLCCCHLASNAQYFDLKGSGKRTTIPFRMIRDMIIIKLNINNKGPFNFILDTGVGLMLITDPKLVDSINIASKRILKIAGIGEGDAFEAYVTSSLNVQIPGLVSYDVAAAILKTDHFGLSNYAGIPIHGLLGYEFFNNLAVKINFSDSTLSVSKSKNLKIFKRGSKIPITIEDRKPYIKAKIAFADGAKTDNKLVLDLGAGHALSLENTVERHGLPEKFMAANLGVGLTGPVNGFLGRIKELDIGKFKIKNVITAFPQGDQFKGMAIKRDGNLGIGILKRFNVIIDYPDSVVYLKPGPNFQMPFEHDMSGLEYYSAGEDFNRIIISRVEPGSPADLIGLEKDDEILAINLKPVVKMTLEQIDSIFKSQPDRSLLLEIYHDNKKDNVILTLKRRI